MMQLMDANSQRNPIPSGYVKIAIENDPVEIVDFPMKNGGSFQFAMSFIVDFPSKKW